MPPTDINSREYWNGRFDADWEVNQGKEQSRFFSNVAYENLPSWLVQQQKQDGWTLCDWGCAQGDGTDVLAGLFGPQNVTGVDFADSAIQKARQAYPAIRFEAQDWLAQDAQVSDTFDIVFSSNTLEHFTRPYDVLPRLMARARRCVTLALPFLERDRIDEHFFSFLPENIPLTPAAGWVLAHAAVQDCRNLQPTHWHGFQIILVYARTEWLQTANLHLADVRFEANGGEADLAKHSAGPDPELDGLRQQQAESHEQLRTISGQLAALSARLEQIEGSRAAEIKDLEAQLAQIRASTSWALTGPLRRLGRLFGRS
ncbi:class I SAM-dependent methyltransferase [Bordetella genomosp. 13]|uniref:class I SAM-dependent methyltransferase n=1 Tax=Bordetella genomosp. 13 TaxID=463040 RepID=UPI00119FC389|nr:class I SAM-dependent methyltransferase [Bordetella genomosp. 13]